jgi:hypothetical protein
MVFQTNGPALDFTAADSRGGSVCLNSLGSIYKWLSTIVMLPPVLAAGH